MVQPTFIGEGVEDAKVFESSTENMKAQIAGHWFYPIMIADEKGELYKIFDLGRSKGWRVIPMRSVRRLITPRVPLRSSAVSLHAPAAKPKVVPPNRFAFSHRFSGSLFLFTRTAKVGLAGKKARLYEWAVVLIFYRPSQPLLFPRLCALGCLTVK